MTSKRVIERRQRNRELGQRDAANRCAFCKAKPVATFWTPFCSLDCLEDERERIAQLAARLAARQEGR